MSDMKTIMESWDKFSKKSDKEILREGFREILIGLSILVGGAVYHQMSQDEEVSIVDIQNEYDAEKEKFKKLIDYSSYGLGPKSIDSKQKTIQLLETNFKDSLIPAPSYEGYSYVFPTEIPNNMMLPMTQVSAGDYRSYCEQYEIIELRDMLYGPAARWGYNIEPGVRQTFHTIDGLQVLPPSWSIMFDVFQSKTFDAIEDFNNAVNNPDELEKVATVFGFDNAEHLETELQQLKLMIQYED